MSGGRLAWYGVRLLISCSQELVGSSPSPRASFNIDLIIEQFRNKMGRRKSQKIVKTGPKNVTTGMCPLCQTIGRIFIIGHVGEERAKCPACNQEFDL